MGISRIVAGACTACSFFSFSSLAPAQEADEPPQGAKLAEAGFRVATQADGFQIIEHGVWSRSSGRLQASPPQKGAPPSFAAFESARQSASRPSGFRRAVYLPHIYAAEAQFALPRGLLDALVWTESRYNPLAISHAGAVGLGQLMPGTAKDLGVTNRYDPQANILGAARYLRQLIGQFGVVHLAVAAYNAGPRAVQRAGGIPRNGETPQYVENVLRNWLN